MRYLDCLSRVAVILKNISKEIKRNRANMVNHSHRPHLRDLETPWDRFWKTFWRGSKPEIIHTDCCTGRISRSLKIRISRKLTALLNVYDVVKIGKTGDSYIRSDKRD
jgi:hypothetical protein